MGNNMFPIVKVCLAIVFVIFIFGGSLSPVFAESLPKASLNITAMWESKYVSEGRDNLNSGGIFSFEATSGYKNLTGGAYFATADRESYEELNLFVEYGFELKSVEGYFGYTRLEFINDDEYDNEISLGIAVNSISYMIPALDYTYSDKATGGFLEFSLRSEIKFMEGQLILEPYILEGFDFGYASEAYDGPNNFQVGMDFTLTFINSVNMVGSAAHSWAQEDVENDGLGDVSWVTIGFSTAF